MSRKLAVQLAVCLLLALPLAAQRRGGNFRNPTEQMQQVFSDAGVPLSADQQKTIEGLMDEQRQSMREFREQRRQSGGGERGRPDPQMFSAMREQMQAKLESVLTPEQKEVWQKRQREEIRQRGGYPALRLMLEEAGAPLRPEQEEQSQSEYREYGQKRRELRRAESETSSEELKDLESKHLATVAKLLDPAQRRALIESRRNAPKPPAN